MPTSPVVIASRIPEGVDWVSVFRILRADGATVTPSDIDPTLGWDLAVYDLSVTGGASRAVPIYSLTAQPSAATNADLPGNPAVLSATLRQDGYWTKGGGGYNWLHAITVADLEGGNQRATVRGGRRYKTEYTLHLSATAKKQDAKAVHLVTVVPMES